MHKTTVPQRSSTSLMWKLGLITILLALMMAISPPAFAQEEFPLDGRDLQQDITEDVLFAETEQVAENLEPFIIHEEQRNEATAKLEALENKTGKKPNILVFLMDDVGWGDIGANGGGAAIGAVTPNIDKLAAEGLRLTSTYSQPSCTSTRATLLTGQYEYGIMIS